MKKIFYLALSLLAFAMTSCFEEEEFGLTGATYEDFTGEISEVDTRTSMGSDGSVLWSENDAISLFKKTGYHQKYKVKTYGSSSTDFQYDDYSTEVTLSSDSHYAVYPFAEGNSISGTELTINLSSLAEQSYTANTFENGKAVMVAKSATTQLAFTNAFSLANIQLKAEAGEAPDEKISVKKIKVESATIPLCGTATIDMSENTPAAQFASDGAKSIVLDCDTDIELSTTPTDFYILMPVATFPANDLTITIYATIAGEQKELAIPMSIEVPFLRSKMTTLTKEIGFDAWTGSTEIAVVDVADVAAANEALKGNAGVKLGNAIDASTTPIVVPAKSNPTDAAVEHKIDLSGALMPSSGTVKITVEEGDGTSKNTVTEVTVVVPDGASYDGLEINAPGTTVTITAADGTVIKKIVGASAENTLIISKGITVNELIVEKGFVRIEEGSVIDKVSRGENNTDKMTYLIYESEKIDKMPEGVVPPIYAFTVEEYEKLPRINNVRYWNLQAAVDAAVNGDVIELASDITEDIEITQKEGVNLVVNGKNYSYTGVMTVFGDARQNGAETLAIKNIKFIAKEGADACILSPDRTSKSPARYSYSHNVTVENCTFTDPDGDVNCAAIRQEDGGDKNWSVKGCTVDNTMHSLLQVNNVEGKLTLDGCDVSSKNGINLNSCTNVEMVGCTFDLKGYAVRFGVSSGGNYGVAKTYAIKNSTLKSACDEGDAVIMFRKSAVDAVLILTDTELVGERKISGYTDETTIYSKASDGTYQVWTSKSLHSALSVGASNVSLAAGNYVMPEPDLRGKTITFNGTADAVIDVTAVDARDQFVTGANLVFDGVTLNFGKVNYMGFANTASLTYKNCNINGLQFLFGEKVSFEGCKLNSNGAEHCVWTYGVKNVSFTNCDFTYGDRGINCYSDNDVPGGKQIVNFKDCTFTTDNTASAGAVEINSCFFSVGIEVNLDKCTAPAYGEMAYVSPWDSTNGAKTTINVINE